MPSPTPSSDRSRPLLAGLALAIAFAAGSTPDEPAGPAEPTPAPVTAPTPVPTTPTFPTRPWV